MKYAPVELSAEERKFAKNQDVAWVQKWLNTHAGQNLQVDGVWGTLSRAAFLAAFANRNAAPITGNQLAELAEALGEKDSVRIRTVAAVESRGGGWFKSGLPKILYERHKFWKWLSNPANRVVSAIANPKWGGYTDDANANGINDSWEKLAKAVGVDPLAALKSISIGKFQVLGEWYRECGYNHPIEMLHAASGSEYAHYAMLRDYILNVAKLGKQFRAICGDPQANRAFAAGYNGRGYEANRYHIKLAQAYIAERARK